MAAIDTLQRKVRARRDLPPPSMRRALRENAGLSQEDLAGALGVHRETVSRWEQGKRMPRGNRLIEYVELLQSLRLSA